MVGKKKNPLREGLTLLEMVIALAMIVVISAAILPQLKVINDGWASKRANAEVLQNARVAIDMINRSLSSADRVTDVSDPCNINGYIEFEDNTGTAYRMDIAASNYIEFGQVGSLSDFAGPVSRLKITCYDDDDLDTPVDIAVDGVDGIRYVKFEIIFTNPGPGLDRTFTTGAYLRTNANNISGTAINEPYEFDSTRGKRPALAQIDSTHYLCAYQGNVFSKDEGWAVVLEVNPSNWNISKVGTPFRHETNKGKEPALAKIDTEHYLCVIKGSGSDGWAKVLIVDTDNWTITQGTPFMYSITKGKSPALAKIDTYHYLCAYEDREDINNEGWASVLSVSSPVGWWKLDELTGITAADSSDEENQGTLTNMAGNEWTAGQIGGALDFDGTNDHIDMGDILDIEDGEDLTITSWFNRDTFNTRDVIVSKRSSTRASGGRGYILYINRNKDKVVFKADDNSQKFTINSATAFTSSGWNHFAVVFNESSAAYCKMYVNGVEESIVTSGNIDSIDSLANDYDLRIGMESGGSVDAFDGKLDDVRIYNTALTEEQILAVMAGGGDWEITRGAELKYNAIKGKEPALSKIDDGHYLCAYKGPNDDGWATVLMVDPDSWTLSQGTPMEFESGKGKRPALEQIDSTHYLCAYTNQGVNKTEGWATVLTVNNITWGITNNTPYVYDPVKGKEAALAKINATDFLCAYQGDGDDGWAAIMTVNKDTWALSSGTPFEFDAEKGKTPALAEVSNSMFLCTYTGNGSDGWAIVIQAGGILRP